MRNHPILLKGLVAFLVLSSLTNWNTSAQKASGLSPALGVRYANTPTVSPSTDVLPIAPRPADSQASTRIQTQDALGW